MSGLTKIRPWLAALLGLAVTGLGHLYLRRWRRAALWVVLAFSISVLFVPTGSLEALATGGQLPPLVDVLPILAVSLISVADAFLLGMKQVNDARRAETVDEDETASCPNCGRDVDPELDFCHWCTTRLDEPRDD
ncbi:MULTISPECIES: zinc ribbon domain-containing protein [Haloferax]|uniref:Zinc ribbon domain-containing protein n=1 Tax=Haloferax marinum TaxID=2666143 RepID=A0A6A8GAA5_9EURY|nr:MULTISPECIES: zinc ribbon domain-containing protein [Haloferax]KAB1198821.1 zinc ribbon domain-containing protein [Haloferax sp. CBA1150]MRW97941.1 zinc ribbon domain-containing protein [Haloferax marinum]